MYYLILLVSKICVFLLLTANSVVVNSDSAHMDLVNIVRGMWMLDFVGDLRVLKVKVRLFIESSVLVLYLWAFSCY